MKINTLIIVIIFLLFSSFTYAQTNEDIQIILVDNSAVITHQIISNQSLTFEWDFNLPSDASGVSLSVDGEFIDITNLEKYRINESYNIILEYVTKKILQDNEILFTFYLVGNDNLNVDVQLDDNMLLRYKTKESISTSVYPTDYTLSSNGQNLIINWKRENNSKNSEFSGFIMLKKGSDYVWFILITLLTLIILLSSLLVKNAKTIKKGIKKDDSKEVKLEIQDINETKENIFEHLKEDEKQIVRILQRKEGSCEQGTLRLIGNFSKATLSRLLSELQERNIIKKEKKGKKNIVHLMPK